MQATKHKQPPGAATPEVAQASTSVDYSALQAEYCERTGAPHFAPLKHCFGCGRDIYSHPRCQQAAAVSLITSCPFCHHSFCD